MSIRYVPGSVLGTMDSPLSDVVMSNILEEFKKLTKGGGSYSTNNSMKYLIIDSLSPL